MKVKDLFIKSLLAITACISNFSHAEDIELYVNHNVEIQEKPRVLLVFDTSGSMAWDVTDGGQCYKISGSNQYNYRFNQTDCFESRESFNVSEQCYRRVSYRTNYYDYYTSNNWSYYDSICNDSRLRVAQNAITQLVNDNDDIEFGLMRFNGSSGGYVLARVGAEKSDRKSVV